MKLQSTKYIFVCAALLAIGALGTTYALAEVVVVVSAKSKIKEMTVSQVAQIFLGKTNKLPDGRDAIPFDQTEGSDIRNEFYYKVTGKDPAQINAYWSKIIFTGDGQPPKVLPNNDSVKKAVLKNLNAIGYIEKSAVDKKVKVILTP